MPFGGFVQVGDGIEGLVHISEMSAHHVESPEQVVTPGEELWVKIIDLDLARRRISLSIKQAAEGGELAEEYREHFGIDEQGNYTVTDDAEREAAWAEYYEELGETPPEGTATPPGVPPSPDSGASQGAAVASDDEAPAADAVVVDEAPTVEAAVEAEDPSNGDPSNGEAPVVDIVAGTAGDDDTA